MRRGRRMTVSECFRIQGISRRVTQGLPATFLRACAGNAMSVRSVSMLLESAFDLMVSFARVPLTVAMPASVETSRSSMQKGHHGNPTSQRSKAPKNPKFTNLYCILFRNCCSSRNRNPPNNNYTQQFGFGGVPRCPGIVVCCILNLPLLTSGRKNVPIVQTLVRNSRVFFCFLDSEFVLVTSGRK